ncbi:MAG: ATP-binding protein [Ignavibacteriae bacterium]|nr:ATP-binding protein [Ignavibacteriota bacterium]
MLIEFKVENFRSIREQQIFSLVAVNSDTSIPENTIRPELPGIRKLRFLKAAALYGANAAGKSNILEALFFLKDFAVRVAFDRAQGIGTGTQPFKLHTDWVQRPSRFEITFSNAGIRYVYGLALTSERVVEEYLDAYPKGQAQYWFRRHYDADSGVMTWSNSDTHFRGTRELMEKTRDNVSFLSVAAFFNTEKLLPVYTWFKEGLQFMALGADSLSDPSTTLTLYQDEKYKSRIVRLLSTADTGIVAMRVNVRPVDNNSNEGRRIISRVAEQENFSSVVKAAVQEIIIECGHRAAEDGFVSLSMPGEESDGTVRYFSLLGPLLQAIEQGRLLIIDELDTSLHPLLVREVLRMAQSEAVNNTGAQLVFTTHNPLLLDLTLLRRDQIWFAEKNSEGATSLYPLTDFKPRKDEALTRGYLVGRYGGIPFIPEGLRP